MDKNIIEGNLSGIWYPKDRELLEKMIKDSMKGIPSLNDRKVKAMILPHAGHTYSAKNALYAIKGLNGADYDHLIILGPSHLEYFKNKIVVPSSSHYKTPLGEITIDQKFISKLQNKIGSLIKQDDSIFVKEHSIDNEIPLLQYRLGVNRFENSEIKLIPIMIGDADEQVLTLIAKALKELTSEKTLVVVSSDFTHHGKNFNYTPFKLNSQVEIENKIKKLDFTAGEFARLGQAKEFLEFVKLTGATICGYAPIYILLKMVPYSLIGELVKYDTSAKLTDGNFDHSVSYLSLIYSGDWEEGKKMNEEEKKSLLNIARLVIHNALIEKKILKKENLHFALTKFMRQKAGAFVTLKKSGLLRGCIGEIFPTRSLIDVIMERALDSAFNDDRFSPLESEELDQIKIEISVLTPPQEILSYQQIEIGTDGIILIKNGKSAVFLPQVAIEQGWNLETTLSHLCLKAGLGRYDWQEGAQFQVFKALVFSE